MTNKYAEGYPGNRYYGGCEFVDQAEEIALERVKKLFKCQYANLQPHSGAQANQAVFLALLRPHDTFLGMSLASGGHLTHGAKPNISGKWFNAIQYGVKKHGNDKDLMPWSSGPQNGFQFPRRTVEDLIDQSTLNPESSRAFDVGCSVGRSSFELTKFCSSISSITSI